MEARCPKCGRRSTTASAGNHRWYCHHCRMEFEDQDDGDITYGRPEKRLERDEARSLKHRSTRR